LAWASWIWGRFAFLESRADVGENLLPLVELHAGKEATDSTLCDNDGVCEHALALGLDNLVLLVTHKDLGVTNGIIVGIQNTVLLK